MTIRYEFRIDPDNADAMQLVSQLRKYDVPEVCMSDDTVTAAVCGSDEGPDSSDRRVGKRDHFTMLVTGGARSGKSVFAESILMGDQIDYVATSAINPEDSEWQRRIDIHRKRRPASWETIETIDLIGVLATDSPRPVLIDCIGVWLTRVMDHAGVWTDEPGSHDAVHQAVADLAAAFASTTRTVVAVTNEVGSGVVPADRLTRYYRDMLGRTNAALASVCDDVVASISGIPIYLKRAGKLTSHTSTSARNDG